MVYSTRRFVLGLDLCCFVFCVYRPLSIAIYFVFKRELILVLSYVWSICVCLVLSVSSSSSCLVRAAACYCGTPWSFLLPFFIVTFVLSLFVPHLSFFWCLSMGCAS